MPDIPVFIGRFQIGTVVATENGNVFSYATRWLKTIESFPISVTMPLQTGAFRNEIITPWLANLLPEEQQLDIVSHSLGVSPSDTLAILSAIGGDTAGALSFGEPSNPDNWSYIPLTAFYGVDDQQAALSRHFDDLGNRPFIAGEDGIRLSLAGGQKKTALAVIDAEGRPVMRLPQAGDSLALPMCGAPSTVIIKPDNLRLPGITENETYCLHLAAAVGIKTAHSCILPAQDRSAFCVLRYDRFVTSSGAIRRVHQEDFAQANSLPPGRKYERGTITGMTLKQLFETQDLVSEPIGNDILEQFIFNVLVANTDAHAKNYSIIHEMASVSSMAPLYDVSTVLPWDGTRGGPKVIQDYAQKLAGKNRRPVDVAPRHWERIAEDIGVRTQLLTKRVVDLTDKMVAARVAVTNVVSDMPGAQRGYVEEAAELIEANALRIIGRIT